MWFQIYGKRWEIDTVQNICVTKASGPIWGVEVSRKPPSCSDRPVNLAAWRGSVSTAAIDGVIAVLSIRVLCPSAVSCNGERTVVLGIYLQRWCEHSGAQNSTCYEVEIAVLTLAKTHMKWKLWSSLSQKTHMKWKLQFMLLQNAYKVETVLLALAKTYTKWKLHSHSRQNGQRSIQHAVAVMRLGCC